MLGILNKEQIDNILHSQTICRLACCDGKKPYVVPISFYYDGKYVYGQTQEGKKVQIMRKNPNICLQTDIINSMHNYQSVCIFGRFEELKSDEASKTLKQMQERIMTMMSRSRVHKFEHDTNAEIPESGFAKIIMFRISIDEITGRYERQTI